MNRIHIWKIFLFILFINTISVFPLYAEEGYIEIGRNDNGVYSLYLPSIEDRGSYFVGWMKIIQRKTKLSTGVRATTSMVCCAVNKSARQTQNLSWIDYDKEGNVLRVENNQLDPDKWIECIPNTIGEALWQQVIEFTGL